MFTHTHTHVCNLPPSGQAISLGLFGRVPSLILRRAGKAQSAKLKTFLVFLIFLFFFGFFFSASAWADSWWNQDWKYRAKLSFNNLGRDEDLTDFPIMVKLTAGRIVYSQTQSAGQDIRFVDADNQTQLAYEIENWEQGGNSYIWVKIPKIDKNSRNDYIWLYWGNPNVGDGQNKNNVWGNNYKAVYHLSESGLTVSDSTNNAFTGTKVSATDPIAIGNGKIGSAQNFDGSNDYIDVGNQSGLALTNTNFTLSFWVKFSAANENAGLVGKYAVTGGNRGWLTAVANTGGGTPQIRGTISYLYQSNKAVYNNNQRTQTNKIINDNNWHFVTATFEISKKVELYIDGVIDKTVTTNVPASIASNDANVTIGYFDSGQYYTGDMDEIHVSNVARSATYIVAQYASMNDTFLTFDNPYVASVSIEDDDVFKLYKFTDNNMPTFVFKKSNDGGFKVIEYSLIVDDQVLINHIPAQPADKNNDNLVNEDEKTFEDDDKYVYYTDNDISVRSKTKAISDGPHKWLVRNLNEANNTNDSELQYLLINSFQTNFSGQFFPLTLAGMTNVGNNLNFNWLTADYAKTKTYQLPAISNQQPTLAKPLFSLWGIAPFNGTNPTYVRATIKKPINNQQLAISNSDFIFQQTASVNDQSQWGINIDKSLSAGEYQVTLESANDKGDYIQLPEFKVVVNQPTETSSSSSVLGETNASQSSNQEENSYPSPAPSPQTQTDASQNPKPSPKHCLWFFCL